MRRRRPAQQFELVHPRAKFRLSEALLREQLERGTLRCTAAPRHGIVDGERAEHLSARCTQCATRVGADGKAALHAVRRIEALVEHRVRHLEYLRGLAGVREERIVRRRFGTAPKLTPVDEPDRCKRGLTHIGREPCQPVEWRRQRIARGCRARNRRLFLCSRTDRPFYRAFLHQMTARPMSPATAVLWIMCTTPWVATASHWRSRERRMASQSRRFSQCRGGRVSFAR